MTIAMPDSITVADLPPGYPAYLGYADGKWPTAAELAAKFPAAHRVILTVTGGTLSCDGIDCEPGNPNSAASADWCGRKLVQTPYSRPIVYASVIGDAWHGMGAVLADLAARGIPRVNVRLLSAHYGAGAHICGPRSCGLISSEMDGTQWTDTFSGAGGNMVDMSQLRDDFFTMPPSGWEDAVVATLPTLKQGAAGQFVANWQGLLVSHAYGYLLGGANTGNVMQQAGVDGVFGQRTAQATVRFQADRGLAADGIVGQQTWTAALTS